MNLILFVSVLFTTYQFITYIKQRIQTRKAEEFAQTTIGKINFLENAPKKGELNSGNYNSGLKNSGRY
jgi:hypothetical protein